MVEHFLLLLVSTARCNRAVEARECSFLGEVQDQMQELLGRRFHRLFNTDKRSVVIAMDHGITEGVMKGFEDPRRLLEQVIAD